MEAKLAALLEILLLWARDLGTDGFSVLKRFVDVFFLCVYILYIL